MPGASYTRTHARARTCAQTTYLSLKVEVVLKEFTHLLVCVFLGRQGPLGHSGGLPLPHDHSPPPPTPDTQSLMGTTWEK